MTKAEIRAISLDRPLDSHTRILMELFELPKPPEVIQCLGCGMEPEITRYYKHTGTDIRCGYECSCGAVVIKGIVVGFTGPS